MTYPLVPYKCGMKVTKARLDASLSVERVAMSLTDQTVTNSVTFVDSTYLFMSVEANSTYALNACLMYSGTEANDMAWQFTFPAGSTMRKSPWGPTITAVADDSTIYHAATDLGTGSQSGIVFTHIMIARVGGWLVTAGNAGTLQFRFAQVVAGAATTASLRAGSWLRVTKVV